jgi:drug/metabolite transporter (DMT)-like permease
MTLIHPLQESGAEIGCRLRALAAMFSATEKIMAKRHHAFLGPALVLVFCVSQAFRDVYFGHVFQGVDFFAVILLAFLASTILFTAIPLLRDRSAFAKLRGHGRTVLMMNLTTALAWSCYFYGLSHLEPSIVNTMHSGMGPLTVVTLAALGARLAKTGHVRWWEYLGYAGIALSLGALAWVVLSGGSGLAASETTALLALAALTVSGASITVSLLYCKRLHDHGVNAEVVTSVRYMLLIAVAAAAVCHKGGLGGIGSAGEAATLTALATILMVLPLYAFQVGIALTAPLTANVLRALGPVFVFALQQIDGRLTYSTPTLIGILVYSAAAIASNVAHARSEAPAIEPGVSARRLRPRGLPAAR